MLYGILLILTSIGALALIYVLESMFYSEEQL
jgi:hypothetical protein